MPRSIKLPFVPASLRQLRETAGCSVEDAAKKVGKDAETIRKWESDDYPDLPTYAKARDLAQLYRYNPSLFLKEVPAQIRPPELPDFRTSEKDGALSSVEFGRNLRLLLRSMELRREFVRQYGPYWELPYQGWVGSESIERTAPDELGFRIRKSLGVDVHDQMRFKSYLDALGKWTSVVEDNAGVFVAQASNQVGYQIQTDELRGLSFADPAAPFVALNSRDSEAGRIYTLFHELAHLWIGQSGISGHEGLRARHLSKPHRQVEAYCDEVAANALMPLDAFTKLWHDNSAADHLPRVESIAHALMASREAVSVRAAKLGFIDWSDYSELRDQFRQQTMPKRGGSSGGDWYRTQARNIGRKYVKLVIGTWLAGQIGIKEAASYLEIKPGQVYRLARTVGFQI